MDGREQEAVKSWNRWLQNQDGLEDHPMHRPAKLGWLLLRKEPIPDSVGCAFKQAAFWLRGKDQVPTLLEVLVGMMGYYFSIVDPRKSDAVVGMPFYENREIFARLLNSQMTWTQDKFATQKLSSIENLTVGLHTPGSGIWVSKLHPERKSEITGLSPVRRLNLN